MALPEHLRSIIEEMIEEAPLNALKKRFEEMREGYLRRKASAFNDPLQRLCYLATRFPATYAAVAAVLQKLPSGVEYRSMLDLGAGPATATLAAWEMLPTLTQATLIEKTVEATALGKELLHRMERQGTWILQDLQGVKDIPKADLTICSYSLGELSNSTPFLKTVWASGVKVLAIIEPGTPVGYKNILKARALLLQEGARVIAPCPHEKTCPLAGTSDWCHFAARLERTRFHRLMKEGTRGYEDEKFSYLIVGRNLAPFPKARIVKRVEKLPGHVRLALCKENGMYEEISVSKKDKELFRMARDAEWGGEF